MERALYHQRPAMAALEQARRRERRRHRESQAQLGLPALRMSKGRRGGLVLFKVEDVDRWAEQFKKGGT